MMAGPCRMLIIDDHPLMRDALHAAALEAAPHAQTAQVGSLKDAEDRLAEDGGVDLVLLDLSLPDADGLAGLVRLVNNPAARRVLVVSATDGHDLITRARIAGADGYVSKSANLHDLKTAIVDTLAGRGWDAAEVELAASHAPPANDLTPAQLRVLEGLMEGRLNKQIAFDMNISEATVKAHVTAVFRKLGVRNRTQAVIAAQSLHLTRAGA